MMQTPKNSKTSILHSSLIRLLIPVFFVCCVNKVSAQTPNEIRVIDYLESDHSIRRETHIENKGRMKNGKIAYRISRQLLKVGGTRYTKNGNPFIPPIRYGGVSIYPLTYSRLVGEDVIEQAGKAIKVVSFDERAETLVEGTSIDEVLGSLANKQNKIEKNVYLNENQATSAWLGITANRVEQIQTQEGEIQASDKGWLVSLGISKKGLVGNKVDKVDARGPGEQAGIRIGDMILELGGTRTNSERKPEIISDFLSIGHRVKCVVARRLGLELKVLTLDLMPGTK